MIWYKTHIKYILFILVSGMMLVWWKSYASDLQSLLYLPFSYKFYRSFQVTEARRYSWSTWYMNIIWSWEYFIHGLKKHSAIDYALPYGTPVLAPMDWYMIASYHNAFLKEKWYMKLYQWTQLHYGLWWYVQIWNPANDIFVVLGHLSSIDELLLVSPPYPTRWKNWVSRRDPTWVTYNSGILQQMINDPITYPGVVYVKRWQRIGTVWVSWIEWDNEMRSTLPVPRKPEYPQSLSRDEPHIHLEVFTVVDWKKKLLDPYNMYNDFSWYPDSNTVRTSLKNTLFKQTPKWRIYFADEK
jgi:hypothetical protein